MIAAPGSGRCSSRPERRVNVEALVDAETDLIILQLLHSLGTGPLGSILANWVGSYRYVSKLESIFTLKLFYGLLLLNLVQNRR